MDKKYKQYIAKTEVDSDDRTVTAVISTIAIDRDKEILLPKGAILDNFLKNPVVQFAHNYSDNPVGKALWVTKGRKTIKAKVKFPTAEESPKADEIYKLFKGGFLNAFSVGFMPIKGHSPTPDEIKKKPEWAEARYVFDEWELLEFSVVPVPANPEALATAVKTKEIALSKECIEELGIESEDDETAYIAGNVNLNIDKDTEIEKVEDEINKASVTIKPDNQIAVEVVAVKVEPVKIKVEPVFNVTELVNDEVNRNKGKVYVPE